MSRSASTLAVMAAVLFVTCGAADAQTSSAVRVGSVLRAPQKTKDVEPVYPPMAVASHVQGVVIFKATIGADAREQGPPVLGGPPRLQKAALNPASGGRLGPPWLVGCRCPAIRP